jgi:hypothetical protein
MATPKNTAINKKTTTTPTQPPSSSNKKENKKNRVVAARPPKTPAPPSSAGAHSRDSDSESVFSEAGSASSLRSALPIFIQKQLAQDIEEAGGIKVFKENSGGTANQLLSGLCNDNKDIYGKRGDKIRARITKKVITWKGLDKAEYIDKVLNRLGVKSSATLEFEQKNTNKVKYSKKVTLHQQLSDDDSSSDRDDEDSSVASSDSIPRRILFSNEEERANPIDMSAPPPFNGAAPPGAGKLLYFILTLFYYSY